MSHRAVVLATGLRFPEGPLFDAAGTLWCSEIEGAGLVAPLTAEPRRIATGGRPNGLALGRDGRIWFCDGATGEIAVCDPQTGRIKVILSGLLGPSDLAFDQKGNLLFTCCPPDSRTAPSGSVECFTAAGAHHVIAEGLLFPNGLAFADGGATLIVAETYGGSLWTGAWVPGGDGRWNRRVLCTTTPSPNGPDGVAVDAQGRVFVAVYGAGGIDVFASDGSPEGRIATAGTNPTNCAFDPSGSLGLVVTETERGELLSFPELGPGAPLFAGPAMFEDARC